MENIKEFDKIILNIALPQSGLERGDIGNVVMIYNNGRGYEVEFITFDGQTVAVETLLASQIRKVSHQEIPHVREMISD
ncbi:DUF4926 domain-containing protein [Dyadobacter sp. CY345]|uniref:DUF4926 domain-containing protein n=1 Tax=Dyadobacter sp. CY345 TaxID=2909335 RepID=UPI001F3F1C77|nr:DUF4926 domain-containing protein [Dyadobacter sp. CY345]MCF2445291.1 DUF4926 domain-containing protein [Dyadobacter sp. CY345]